jgi:hypothetical protein
VVNNKLIEAESVCRFWFIVLIEADGIWDFFFWDFFSSIGIWNFSFGICRRRWDLEFCFWDLK